MNCIIGDIVKLAHDVKLRARLKGGLPSRTIVCIAEDELVVWDQNGEVWTLRSTELR